MKMHYLIFEPGHKVFEKARQCPIVHKVEHSHSSYLPQGIVKFAHNTILLKTAYNYVNGRLKEVQNGMFCKQ